MGTKYLKAFGQRVRGLRKERSISQEALANLAALDRAYLGKVERGEINISLLNIIKIAHALKVSASELI
jgi:transcriptional regulator with XRE-family HTH domain